jgi:hypothetical protein
MRKSEQQEFMENDERNGEEKKFWNIYPEIGVRKITGRTNQEMCQKLGLYLNRYTKGGKE